jgi:hypothetical protein
MNPTQVINNIKRSFNAYAEEALAPSNAAVNFDLDPFDTSGLTEWFAIRYTGCSSESSGMGDLVTEDSEVKGRIHRVSCEISAWRRADPQRSGLGDMADMLISLCEIPSITLYDYTDPENPVECGTMSIQPRKGRFTPSWSGGAPVYKSSSDLYSDLETAGFILEFDLITITELE